MLLSFVESCSTQICLLHLHHYCTSKVLYQLQKPLRKLLDCEGQHIKSRVLYLGSPLQYSILHRAQGTLFSRSGLPSPAFSKVTPQLLDNLLHDRISRLWSLLFIKSYRNKGTFDRTIAHGRLYFISRIYVFMKIPYIQHIHISPFTVQDISFHLLNRFIFH